MLVGASFLLPSDAMSGHYGLLADLIGAVHALFVLFVVVGQALIMAGWARGWAWTRRLVFRATHLAAIAFVVVQAWLGRYCPLSIWENELRERAGAEGHGSGFIAYWLERFLYWSFPQWVFVAIYSLFGLLVLLAFIYYPPRRRRR